jgi:protocatechuate 3,4-dioxygenase beta subunit
MRYSEEMKSASDANRREVLRFIAGASLVPLIGCQDGDGGGDGDGSAGDGSAGDGGDGACEAIPGETAGPFPGDGSNGANALALDGIVRSDIRGSIAGASATAEGVSLIVELTVVAAGGGCAPLAGRAIYLWHCDREGRYSMYSEGVTEENYLRGVQETGADGVARFTTVFPGCYPGRMPHMHFSIYPSLAAATAAESPAGISQLALPVEACDQVYREPGYERSREALGRVSFETDGVFSDGVEQQLASVEAGKGGVLVAALRVGVAD